MSNAMDASSNSDEKTECDSITAVELQKSRRVLYFSDGIMEELSESDGEDIGPDITDKSMNVNIDIASLPLGPRIKYQAYQMGSRFLNGIDYVGEGLASFFGITTPKYMSESDVENAEKGESEVNGLDEVRPENGVWYHNNNINTSNIVITRLKFLLGSN
ncbi:protein FAM177B isoform X2 [Lucilia sericata]|uniref:protein FAM177B isoform X2 n=1 Tax=Lucilia sericata TaxID=13632 RepID=UPI0018A81C89|nr:protein FAM177B isoform X2 [Lucilia sericata]